jgi:hypothetical protein
MPPVRTGRLVATGLGGSGPRAGTALALTSTLVLALGGQAAAGDPSQHSVARRWNEALLEAIRLDYPAPTVHSRNLFHLSAAMWDAWIAYEMKGEGVFTDERESAPDVAAARDEAISYAAYRLLTHRFTNVKSSPGAAAFTGFDELMLTLDYDPDFTATSGGVQPGAELGNRIAAAVIALGASDGSNEEDPFNPYVDLSYAPVNQIMKVDLPGATQPDDVTGEPPELIDPNLWQPLSLDFLILQNGIIIGATEQTFLGAGWGAVTPFALVRASEDDVYDDPGPPPRLGCPDDVFPCASDTAFKEAVVEGIRYSSQLDPDDPVWIDISPGAFGNNALGTNDGTGFPTNPATGEPYAPNLVRRGDFGRVLAEFWADGPSSETPPGHWNTLANSVSDSPLLSKRFRGRGPELDALQWDVMLYLALNGAVYDAAIAAWDAKRKYDTARPITLIRYMGGKGQSSDPLAPSYHPHGLPLVADLVELVSEETAAPGGRHEGVVNRDAAGQPLPDPPLGQIVIRSWPGQPEDPENEYSGATWIRAVDWLPYQRETFVTPPFAGYTSGHSTFSRAAAEVLTRFTGSPFFPGGLGTFLASRDVYLAFEAGPSEDVALQWATYYDAADQAGVSRLWGGIHVRADDFGGRLMGSRIGIDAFRKARVVFAPEPGRAPQAAACGLVLAWLHRRTRRGGCALGAGR